MYLHIMLLSLSWSLQALMALAIAGSFSTPESLLTTEIYAEFQGLLIPEHETFYYRFFVCASIVFSVGIFYAFKSKMFAGLMPHLRRMAWVEAGYTVILIAVAFKILANPDRSWPAQSLLIAGLAAALLLKFYLFCLDKVWQGVTARLILWAKDRWLVCAGVVFAPLLITLLIFVPDIEGMAARMYAGEQFHHNDSFIMGPVWALEQGLRLDIDVISQYGIGFPYVVRAVSKWWAGGVDYTAVLKSLVLMTTVYYILWFWLLRMWLNSVLLALAAVIIGIKWQLFHPGVYPIVYTYGSTTPVRFWADVIFFICVWKYLSSGQKVFAVLAGAICGFQMFYLTSEGVYLYCAWAALTWMVWFMARPWQTSRLWSSLAWMAGAWVLPFIVLGICLYAAVGRATFDPVFWANVREFSGYFLSGFGVEPMTKNIVDRQFGAALMGFIVPIVYIATLCAGIIWSAFRQGSPALTMAMVMSVYGLGSYHYFVARSTLTSYYVEGLAFAWVLFFWVGLYLSTLTQTRKIWISVGLLAGSIGALLSTHMFMSYPNVFNAGRNPYTNPQVVMSLPNGGGSYLHHLFRREQEEVKVKFNSLGSTEERFISEADFANDEAFKTYYRSDFDFRDDAALIRKLTPDGARVPLISSFEIKMLMQANRAPYFYYFPLIISHPLTSRTLVRSSVYTTDQYQKVIGQLDADKPEYIFMERGLAARPVPESLNGYYASFMYLREYVFQHYEPVEQSKTLIAYRRKKNGS